MSTEWPRAHLTFVRNRFIAAAVLLLCSSLPRRAAATPSPNGKYVATAYSVSGKTASGQYTHRHVVAADPDILPIGSRIRIQRAGRYSGEYVVADTGEKIVGRKLDIYMPSTAECKKFGKKKVRVTLIERGDGTTKTARAADQVVKEDAARDVEKGVVGRAATETDWAAKKRQPQTPGAPAQKQPPQ